MAKQKKSALSEKKGVSHSEITNKSSIEKIKNKRKEKLATKTLIDSILNKDITALSRAITLIESKNPKHLEQANSIIKGCLPYANNSIRIGITGVPGVGKSTFIEVFGKHLTDQGKRVAVLAIDPTSSLTKGSILGDKTRMEDLVKNENAFIRPSASGNSLGGVARKTRETINRALHLYPEKSSNWQPKVTLCSALNNEGIDAIWTLILDYIEMTNKNNFFNKKRSEQNKFWLIQTIENQLKSEFFNRPEIKKELANQLQLIETNKTTPFVAADYLLNLNKTL